MARTPRSQDVPSINLDVHFSNIYVYPHPALFLRSWVQNRIGELKSHKRSSVAKRLLEGRRSALSVTQRMKSSHPGHVFYFPDLTANASFLLPLKAKFSLVRTELDWKGTGCLQMPNHT